MDEKLKPCPLCGGEADLKRGLYVIDNYVMCRACKTKTTLYNTKDEAIKRWNTRKPIDRIVEQLDTEVKRAILNFSETYDSYYEGKMIAYDSAEQIVKGVQNE